LEKVSFIAYGNEFWKIPTLTHIVPILPVQIPWLLQVDVRIRDYTCIRQMIWCVCVREQAVRDEDVAGFRFDLSEFGTVRDVGMDGDVGVGRVKTFRMGVEGFGYAWMLKGDCQ